MGILGDGAGLAELSFDTNLHPWGYIIPANSTDRSVNIYARQDQIEETLESYSYLIFDSPMFQIVGSNSIDFTIVDCNLVGLSAKSELAQLAVYPNPAEAYLHFILPESIAIGQAKIYDQTGRLLLTQSISGQQGKIDISALSGGLFLGFIQAEDNRSIGRLKFVKLNP